MRPSIDRVNGSGQPTTVEHRESDRSTSVDQSLECLRQVVIDKGWSLDALQAHMKKDRSFINKVLNGDKPMPEGFLDALPDEIEKEYHRRCFERHGGVGVDPVDAETARRHLVSGLIGILAPQLPAKADGMARMNLDVRRKVAR